MPELRLPNGKEVFCIQKREVLLMFDEIQEYLKHGITLSANDVVFDVGANIGLFTLWLAEQFGCDLAIYAFEPIPAIFEVLSKNVQRHQLSNAHLFPFGLSKESQVLEFAYFPIAPIISTAFPNGWKDELGAAMLHNLDQMPTLVRWLAFLPISLRRVVIRQLFKFVSAEPVECVVEPLSKIIRERGVQQIDLLKIDVEKSELDVLLGIADEDWPKIRQIVVEVHDVDDRVKVMEAMFRKSGFTRIVLEHGPVLTSSNIVSLYATR